MCKTYIQGVGDVWYPTPTGHLMHLRPAKRFICPTDRDPLFLRSSCIHSCKRGYNGQTNSIVWVSIPFSSSIDWDGGQMHSWNIFATQFMWRGNTQKLWVWIARTWNYVIQTSILLTNAPSAWKYTENLVRTISSGRTISMPPRLYEQRTENRTDFWQMTVFVTNKHLTSQTFSPTERKFNQRSLSFRATPAA